jgi:putative ABC transport system ATP-binding protein
MPGFPVVLAGVARRYRTGPGSWLAALDGLDLELAAGEMVAVAGPSGSGKSTLLHVVGAMDRPDEGTVRVGEQEVSGLSGAAQARFRRTIGFVFQRFHLLPALSVTDNVLAPVLPYRTPFDKHARAAQLLERVGLADRDGSLPSRLSGGEQQRVAIARALVNDPGLLLADEPTGNLDSAAGAGLMRLLLELRAERGMTVLVATHDPVVASHCDRIVRLADGRVVDDTTVVGADPEAVLSRISRLAPGE